MSGKQTVRSNRLDALGDRMKSYERIETEQRFKPNSILYVRLDGRGFSKFTKGLKRPFDERLSSLMIETTKHLVENFKCTIGYTQSDEISLIIKNDYEAPCDFDGKKQKLISSLSASATAFFNVNLLTAIPEKFNKGNLPCFDCRIFEVPNEVEAYNAILWREKDAIKNSISMLAQHHFSHKELQGKKSDVMKDMLKTQKDVIWEDQPKFFKSGTYVKRELYVKTVPDSELGLQHGTTCVRSRITEVDVVLGDLEPSARYNLVMGKNFIDYDHVLDPMVRQTLIDKENVLVMLKRKPTTFYVDLTDNQGKPITEMGKDDWSLLLNHNVQNSLVSTQGFPTPEPKELKYGASEGIDIDITKKWV